MHEFSGSPVLFSFLCCCFSAFTVLVVAPLFKIVSKTVIAPHEIVASPTNASPPQIPPSTLALPMRIANPVGSVKRAAIVSNP